MTQTWVCAAAFLSLQLAASSPAPAVFAIVHGRAVRLGGSDPVAHARITLAKVGGPLADYRAAVADESGVFAFRDLTPGVYRIYADRDGYLQAEYGRRAVSPAGTRITLAAGQTLSDVVVAMTPTAVIAGHVFDRGRPVRRVVVRALKQQYSEGRRLLAVTGYAETDDRGEYRISGLAPGFYLVGATPKVTPFLENGNIVFPVPPSNANNNQGRVTVVLSPETLDPAVFDPEVMPTVFYPGTPDTAAAAPINVRAGDVVAAIDLALMHVSSFHVRGRIATDGTAPPVRVQLRAAESGPAVQIPGTDVRADGTFDLSRVPPGRYLLFAQTVDQSPQRMMTTVPVTVTDRDVEDVSIAFQPNVNVSGHLTVDGQPFAGGVPVPIVQLQSATAGGYTALRYDTDGGFTLPNVAPGDYRFRVVVQNRPLYLESARFGDDDVMDRMLTVSGSTAGRELDVRLSSKTGTLDAVAMDRESRPAGGLLVIVVPDLARRGRSQLYKTATTDDRGRAHLDGLAPGEYRVFATADVEASAWQDPDVLRLYEGRGELVTVRPGATLAVTLRITP